MYIYYRKEKELNVVNSELSSMKLELSSILQQVNTLKLAVSDAEMKASFSESTKISIEEQRNEILKEKGELKRQILLQEEMLLQLNKKLLDNTKNNQYLLEEKLNQSHASSTVVISDLQEIINDKTDQIDSLTKKLDSCLELEKSYLSQIESSNATIKKLEIQVQLETQQAQDRKTKFKAYIDNVSTEKQSFEFQLISIEKQNKDLIEKNLNIEDNLLKLQSLYNNLLEKYNNDIQLKLNIIEESNIQIFNLQEQNKCITEEMKKKYTEELIEHVQRTTTMQNELEELNLKRNTARNELIKMAQVIYYIICVINNYILNLNNIL